MNIPDISTTTSAMTTGEALWELAYLHTEAYWAGCVRGEWGKKPKQCRQCDILRAALGSDWAIEAQHGAPYSKSKLASVKEGETNG